MLSRLESIVADIAVLHSKLVLLIGPPRAGKTALLREFGDRHSVEPLQLGSALSRRLVAMSQRERCLRANDVFGELAHLHAQGDFLLVDNIEILFDRSPQLNPLDVLKRHARSRRVVATWPGELRGGRLNYAEIGHPEQRDYGIDGVVAFEVT